MATSTLPRVFVRTPGRYHVDLNDDGSHAVVNTQTCEHVATYPPNDNFAADILASNLNAQDAMQRAGINPHTGTNEARVVILREYGMELGRTGWRAVLISRDACIVNDDEYASLRENCEALSGIHGFFDAEVYRAASGRPSENWSTSHKTIAERDAQGLDTKRTKSGAIVRR